MKKIVFTIILTFLFVLCTAPIKTQTVFTIIQPEPLVKGFNHYFDDLGYRETGENPNDINQIGCFAKHQWKESTLHSLGFTWITLKKFKADPNSFPDETQRLALKLLNMSNERMLKDFEPYVGTYIDGIQVTRSGLLAASHLAGVSNVRKFLLTNGTYIIVDGWQIPIKTTVRKSKYNKKDMNGTSIKDYLAEFSGYSI
jgi:hypothetical protein